MAVCPGHSGGKEQTPSLSVREGDSGKVLLNCMADGCSTDAVLSGLGMVVADLFPPKEEPSGRRDAGKAKLSDPRVTLAAFADFLKLPAKFLEEQGLENHTGGVSLSFRDEDDKLLFRKIRKHLTDKKLKYRYETTGTAVVPYGLWRLPDISKADNKYLVICEGETDCLTLWHHGIHALGMPGATTADKLLPEYVRGVEEVYILQEPGAAGETFVRQLGERLAAIGWTGTAKQVRMPDDDKDPSQMHKAGPGTFKARFRKLYTAAQPLDAPRIEDMFVTLDDVEEQAIEFLWWPYLVKGGLNIVMGAPGEGKGQTTMALAAAVTAGAPFPGSTVAREPADVLIFSPEDNINRIIKKRFRLSGGDGKRAHVFNFEVGEFGFEADDLIRLEAALDKWRPALVVFDPYAKFSENININNANEVGRSLRPLSAIFERRNITCVLVAHTKKGAVTQAIEGLSGSIQVSAIVRSVVGIYRNPKKRPTATESHGLWTHVKHNNSPQGESVEFTVTNGEDNFSRFAWGNLVGTSAQDIATGQSGGGGGNGYGGDSSGGATEAATEFLAGMFESAGNGSGELSAADVQRLAREMGISQATLHRARTKMKVECKRVGFGAGSRILWYMTNGHAHGTNGSRVETEEEIEARMGRDDKGEEEVPF